MKKQETRIIRFLLFYKMKALSICITGMLATLDPDSVRAVYMVVKQLYEMQKQSNSIVS